MKIYISGPMTGRVNYNYFRFFEIEKILKTLFKNAEIINPAYEALEIAHHLKKELHNIPRETYMNHNLFLVKIATHIFMLEEWESSKGAVRELEEAKKYNIQILYEV